MKLIIFVVCSCYLLARINPFIPTKDIEKQNSINQTTKEILKQESISLPSDARIIKEISIKYQSLNGGYYEKTLELDKKIDWHNPILITHKNPFNSISKIEKKVKVVKKKSKYRIKKTLEPFGFIALRSKANSLFIYTKDKLLRNFTVPKPYKIVLDFKRVTNFDKKRVKALTKPFKSFFFGEHKGYYRMVITLDGFYTYNIVKTKKGYKLDLK